MKKIFILIALFALLLCACQKRTSIILSGEIDVESTIALADSAYDREDYETALYYYLQLEDYFNIHAKGTKDLANFYNTIGRCYHAFYDVEMQKKYFEKSAEVCEKLGYDELNFDNYWYLTSLYNDKDPENSDKALEYGKKSEQAAERFFRKDSTEVAETYARQGEVYTEREEYEQAEIYYQKALNTMSKSLGEQSNDFAQVCLDLGDFYRIVKKYEDSLIYLQRAEEIFVNNQNAFKLGQVYFIFADVYLEKKEYEKSIEYCDMCIELYAKQNIVNTDLAACHYEKSLAAFHSGDKKAFEEEIVKAHKICEEEPEQSQLAKDMIGLFKRMLGTYYDEYYEGDKSSGFEAWYQELITD